MMHLSSIVGLVVALGAGQAVGQWVRGWDHRFSLRGVWLDPLGDTVRAVAVYDDGSGTALYVGGDFGYAGRIRVLGLARWDGQRWDEVGDGGSVAALLVHDDGSGPLLYVGGSAWGGIQTWDGTTLSYFSKPVGGYVKALAVYDDGSGAALFVGGDFDMVEYTTRVNNIAKWDGENWWPLGGGLTSFDGDPRVDALVVHDDGRGPSLFASGHFTKADGAPVANIARWDGQAWHDVGGGLPGSFTGAARDMAVWDDGSGPALYAGGDFLYAGWLPAGGLAKWDGQAWSVPVEGEFNWGGIYTGVDSLAVYDDGRGEALYIGGSFNRLGEDTARGLIGWDGENWSQVGGGVHVVFELSCLKVLDLDDGRGLGLYAGGDLFGAGEAGASGVARWDQHGWSGIGEGQAPNGWVFDLLVHDEGSGPSLYAGGEFGSAGGAAARRVARWDGEQWAAVGVGAADRYVYRLGVFDLGSGPALYAAGDFREMAGREANAIARWDGEDWWPLGRGLREHQIVGAGEVWGMGVFDLGEGPELYVGGDFAYAGDVPVNNVAKWDGQRWSALGDGIDDLGTAFALFDDGSGPKLYVGGRFTSAGGQPAMSLATWDGSAWAPVSGGLTREQNKPGVLHQLRVYDDGSGSALYVAGSFLYANGEPIQGIARWDGERFSQLGTGVDAAVVEVRALDLGDGPKLYAGLGYSSVSSLQCWDGEQWELVGNGVSGGNGVWAIEQFDDGRGPALYLGLQYGDTGPHRSFGMARWGCLDTGDMNCDGLVDFGDINPFVRAVHSQATYEDKFPNCNWLNGDVNGDGLVDFGDINPFIKLLGE